MEEIIAVLIGWGVVGLVIAAFTESFCSPILPDILLIPLAIAQPEHAVYYGLVATASSVLGGFIGYGIGSKAGVSAAKLIIPVKYEEKIRKVIEGNAAWAIFLAAMSPIPYKFICIIAGALKISFPVFFGVSLAGRAKRFLLEGFLVYYFGPAAIRIFAHHTDELMMASIAIFGAIAAGIYYFKRSKQQVEAGH